MTKTLRDAKQPSNPGAAAMPADEEAPGPWAAGDTYPSGRTTIYCYKTRRLEYPTLATAERMCDELNAAERVRDAAPQLLAACKAALETINNPAAYTLKELSEMLEASIKSAEGEQ